MRRIGKPFEFLMGRAGELSWERVPQLSINFEEILSRDHGNFEEQSKVLEFSIILLITVLLSLMHSIILQSMHSTIITFLIRAFPKNAIRKTIWK